MPIYKVEPYLNKCLQQLLDQDIPEDNYEIICVNDGSPDNSRSIVLEYQEKHQNIILLDQSNQGVSVARNNGIINATGKYLLFIDPDDYIDSNVLNRSLTLADENRSEVSFLGFTVLNEDGFPARNVRYENFSRGIHKGTDAYFLTHSKGGVDPDRIYAILLEKGFINRNGLRFLPGVPYLEDGELLTRILCLSERCIFIDGPFYNRTTRPGSATNSNLFYSRRAIDGFIKSAESLRNFRDNTILEQSKKIFLNQPIIKYVVLAVSATGKLSGFREFLYVRSKLKLGNLNKLEIKGGFRMYQKLGRIYNKSSYLLFFYILLRPYGHILKKLFSVKNSNNSED